MPEPQSTAFFVLLMMVFAALPYLYFKWKKWL